jgi:hypothetical protein
VSSAMGLRTSPSYGRAPMNSLNRMRPTGIELTSTTMVPIRLPGGQSLGMSSANDTESRCPFHVRDSTGSSMTTPGMDSVKVIFVPRAT